MGSVFIDRRKSDKNKSIGNRQKLVKRVRKHTKNLIKKNLQDGNITDITSHSKKQVNVSGRSLRQPRIIYNQDSGKREHVFPGNKQYQAKDWLERPSGGAGEGNNGKGAGKGEGEDDFEFLVTQDEYLDAFFGDLELPDLVKTDLNGAKEKQYKRAGFIVDGPQSRLNLIQTLKRSIGRRVALRNPKKKKIKQLEEEKEQLMGRVLTAPVEESSIFQQRIHEIDVELLRLRKKLKAIPFIETVDLRYNYSEEIDVPITQAVMFCVMDVSGSMGQEHKDMAKRFFMLLYLFLFRNYERVQLVFIRHTEDAKEVDEKEFFYSKDSGGTLIAPAMELTRDIIKDRFPTNSWNIYICQASDGDVFGEDATHTVDVIRNDLLPISQYFAYVEIGEGDESRLWETYTHFLQDRPNFDMAAIETPRDIFTVFKKLFEKS